MDFGYDYIRLFDRYRAPRCDYFDGETLAGAPFHDAEPLNALTSLLDSQHNLRRTGNSWDPQRHGVATVNRNAVCDELGCTVHRCIAQHFVSCTACESYELREASDRLEFNGRVQLGEEEVMRDIRDPGGVAGACDSDIPNVCLP